jgi:Glycolipid transfer protein (GLTP)
MNRCVLLSCLLLLSPLPMNALPRSKGRVETTNVNDKKGRDCIIHINSFSQQWNPSTLRRRFRGSNFAKTTMVGELAFSFEPVLSQRGLMTRPYVDTELLLRACQTFVVTMRKTGQKAVANDLENNVRKVEALYRKAPVERRQTLSSLLEYEQESGIHGPGGALADPSGAIGLLWIRRSLAFQSKLYSGVLETTKNTIEAAMEAYQLEVQPFHGWALRRLYTMSFETVTPPRKEMLARIGGFKLHEFGESEEQATIQDLQKLLSVWEPIIVHFKQTYQELDLEDSRRV